MSAKIENPGADLVKTYTVTQYNTAIQRYLRDKVPDTWVHGVITQLNVRGKVAYITIGQFEEGNPRPVGVLQVFLWASEFEAWNIRFSRLPTPFELRVELKVSFLIRADFYVPMGKFQPKVVKIDENFTLGELAQTRRKILEALIKDGLMDKNKLLPLSPIPLKIGLITAPGSAAYKDFTSILLNSPFAFDIHFYPAKMQGDSTEKTVLKAFEALKPYTLDLVCLIRGGGSKTDLVYFDSESICRAIAHFPIPVITGIGHEIDTSIADMVAWENKITPTDCAKFIENRLSEAYSMLHSNSQGIIDTWREQYQTATYDLSEKASAINHAWHIRQSGEWKKMSYQLREISGTVRRALKVEHENQKRMHTGIIRGPQKILTLEHERAHSAFHSLVSAWKKDLLNAGESLRLKKQLIKTMDPRTILKQGYTILRNKTGSLVTGVSEFKTGQEFEAELKDGYINGTITSTREKHG
ncbi:MAG: exodeoxyribonuclease VII large subunit [Fibrobacteria bacterium]|nr:exodeoxyribonuclease VII large subunit [Fibrobacteria bacterium]